MGNPFPSCQPVPRCLRRRRVRRALVEGVVSWAGAAPRMGTGSVPDRGLRAVAAEWPSGSPLEGYRHLHLSGCKVLGVERCANERLWRRAALSQAVLRTVPVIDSYMRIVAVSRVEAFAAPIPAMVPVPARPLSLR